MHQWRHDDEPRLWDTLRELAASAWEGIRRGDPDHCYAAIIGSMLGFATVWVCALPVLRAHGIF